MYHVCCAICEQPLLESDVLYVLNPCLLLQYLTLVFIGGISASSLRGFLNNMSKVRLSSVHS